ncbi:hypothetical protein AYI70_g9841 [Smittium culicis]|uniref:Uncharacterized protein n=1 Tax=Smittium culicis TaxID=133412 RepID=A0A1R1X9I3_9FUNG|nr:hypothetical protein AYI70_g9841 [Smittium culicis]
MSPTTETLELYPERKARNGNIKIGFVFKSSEAEILEVPADLSAESGQQIPKTKNNTYRTGDSEGYHDNNSSSIDDIVAPNINSVTVLRASHPPIIEDISKSDSIRDGAKIDVIPPKIMVAKKTVIYSDDYQESSDYEESSSPIRDQFLKYVSIVDRAPQGSNAANINMGSELLGESFTDTEMSESPI